MEKKKKDAPRSFSRARFARELADVFEKNEEENKTTSVYRLTQIGYFEATWQVTLERFKVTFTETAKERCKLRIFIELENEQIKACPKQI